MMLLIYKNKRMREGLTVEDNSPPPWSYP